MLGKLAIVFNKYSANDANVSTDWCLRVSSIRKIGQYQNSAPFLLLLSALNASHTIPVSMARYRTVNEASLV